MLSDSRDHNEKALGESPNLPCAQVPNEEFTETGPSLSAKIKSQDLVDIKVERNINSMVISLTDAKKISKLVTKMKSKSSKDNDEIGNKILKLCSPIIDPYPAEAINHAIENKHFPDCLKIAKVIPVFKKGKTDDSSNYRRNIFIRPFK